MAAFIQRCCNRCCGRPSSAREHAGPLLPSQCDPDAIDAAVLAADSGLRQLRKIRQLFACMQDIVEVAMVAVPPEESSGRTALAVIEARMNDLETMLRSATSIAGTGAGSSGGSVGRWGRPLQNHNRVSATHLPRVRVETASCLVQEGKGTWYPGTLEMCDSGMLFSAFECETGDCTFSGKHISWNEISSIGTRDPGSDEKSPGFGCVLFEADVDLREQRRRIHLQFSTAAPMWRLQYFFKKSTTNSATPSEISTLSSMPTEAETPPAWDVIMAEFRKGNGKLTVDVHQLCEGPLVVPGVDSHDDALAVIRQTLLSPESDSWLHKLWRMQGVEEILAITPWEHFHAALDGVEVMVRSLHFVVPLKPRPMAPKQTRMSIVYCLTSDPKEGTLTINNISQSLDIPFTFNIQARTVYQRRDGNIVDHGGGPQQMIPGKSVTVSLASSMGIQWLGRCMVKGMVETAASSEATEASKRVAQLVQEELMSKSGIAIAIPDQPE